MPQCYLMLGSNIGDREQNLTQSIEYIEKLIGSVLNRSFVYESEPWGYKDNTNYYNQAICIQTSKEPLEVLSTCLSIENKLGRVRNKDAFESRTIDIDILFYEMDILISSDLILPHPRILERKFVLLPLNEIAQNFIHPISKKTIREHLEECEDTSWVKKVE